MAVLLHIKNAHKRYGDQVLLDGAEASITDDVKMGFVGRNGAGKSTLLRVLLGEEELDRGEIIRHPKLRLGYLRQHDPFLPGETAIDFLQRDSGQPDWKCGEVAGQFEIKGAMLAGPVSQMSGGWQTRLKLAALLLHEPNLLLLDEPTNFLDVRTQILLEHFLREFREACLIVSHDRAFLRATCQHTLDLSRGKLTTYPGKIDEFIENQRERREHDQRVNATTRSKMKQLEEFIAKNRARASTATRAKSKSKQLEKLELIEIDGEEATATIRPPMVEPRKGPAVRCRNLSIGYPDKLIADDIDLEIEHGSRAAIVGDNGQGKTTFLRTLVDSLAPLAGDVKWGYGCNLGTYAQHVYTSLPADQTVLEYLEYNAAPGTKDQTILDMAGALLFRGEAVKKRVRVLSGGERARLCLAGILLSQYNILILDETGNHLDVDTVDALAEALVSYQGTIIFTSHDRDFMQRVATSVIEVRDGHVTNYHGDYDAYLYSVNQEVEAGEREEQARRGHAGASSGGGKKAANNKPRREERTIRKELQNIEKTISRLDARKKEFNEQLMNEANPDEAMRLHDEITKLTVESEAAETRWCEIQAELEDV
jgi:ATP-binding cassette subfamily F protein 3